MMMINIPKFYAAIVTKEKKKRFPTLYCGHVKRYCSETKRSEVIRNETKQKITPAPSVLLFWLNRNRSLKFLAELHFTTF